MLVSRVDIIESCVCFSALIELSWPESQSIFPIVNMRRTIRKIAISTATSILQLNMAAGGGGGGGGGGARKMM
jgi:hypothetical protein